MKNKNSKNKSTKALLKDSQMNTIKNNLPPVFVESWHTDIRQKLKLGDRLVLPTIVGKMEFEVVSIEGDRALLECGMTQCRLKKQSKDVWRYNHVTWPKDLVVKVQIV